MQMNVVRLEALGSQINPLYGCQHCPTKLRAQLNFTRITRKKVTTPRKHVLCLSSHESWLKEHRFVSQASLKKGSYRSWRQPTLAVQVKWWFPATAGSSSTLTRPISEKLKKGWLLDESSMSHTCWRGSRHLVEPTWVTHLLRPVIANSVVECILRAKTLPLNLAGTGQWRDPKGIKELPSP